jgi:putative addiction module component (TIGR02574 family)
MTTDELLDEVLRLPRDQRARVAEEVLSSLEESEETVARAWASELERRSAEIRSGHLQGEEWDSVRGRIEEQLRRRSANRCSS